MPGARARPRVSLKRVSGPRGCSRISTKNADIRIRTHEPCQKGRADESRGARDKNSAHAGISPVINPGGRISGFGRMCCVTSRASLHGCTVDRFAHPVGNSRRQQIGSASSGTLCPVSPGRSPDGRRKSHQRTNSPISTGSQMFARAPQHESWLPDAADVFV